MNISVLISSHNRASLLYRTLCSIARNPPPLSYEVILADDGSTDDILAVLRKFSAVFPWSFIRVDREIFVKETGITPFFNCPAWTNNVAARHARGQYLILQGNEVMVWKDCYNQMMEHHSTSRLASLVFSQTYDVSLGILSRLTAEGDNFTEGMLEETYKKPLHTEHYRSDVTNYCSLTSRAFWEKIGGYDERYLGGISAEDSDFIRRARAVDGFESAISAGISLHQNHGGKTRYQQPKPSVISLARFNEGCAINRVLYDSWNGNYQNPQKWLWGTVGITEVITQ